MTLVLTFLGLYLLSTGASVLIFSYLVDDPGISISSGDLADARARIAELPKTEECPINGGMFSEVERDIWEGRRPVTAVIENHVDARPLSGLSKADVVYEAVAEGGITRLLGVFYCDAASESLKVAVIRSARVYFVNWAAEYGEDPIFLHWGGANSICGHCYGGVKPKSELDPRVDAFALLSKLGWRSGQYGNDFDGGTTVGFPVVVRDETRLGGAPVSSEHQPAANLDELYKEAEKRKFGYKDEDGVAWDENFESWSFIDESPSSSPEATKISFDFWNNNKGYEVEWRYDPQTNTYMRYNGGEAFVDWEYDSETVGAKNVVIMFVDEEGPVDSEKHMYYDVTGGGKAIVFQNGNVVKGTWTKKSIDGRTKFYDTDGKDISFVRGAIWIEAVPDGNDIDY